MCTLGSSGGDHLVTPINTARGERDFPMDAGPSGPRGAGQETDLIQLTGDGYLDRLSSHLSDLARRLEENAHVAVFLLAHPDDELACFALISELAEMCPTFLFIFTRPSAERALELKASIRALKIEPSHVFAFDFPDGGLRREQVYDVLVKIRTQLRPNIVVTHAADRHPDHREISAATGDAYRSQANVTILRFEVGQLADASGRSEAPLIFGFDSRLSESKAKATALYRSQAGKIYTDPKLVSARDILNGSISGTFAGERYYLDRMILRRLRCKCCGEWAFTFTPRTTRHGQAQP